MVVPEMIIPLLDPPEFPGGFGATGSASSVEEQEVKNAAPKVAKTKELPAFSRNFLRESVKLPDFVLSDWSILREVISYIC
jgi:hypothetical protein